MLRTRMHALLGAGLLAVVATVALHAQPPSPPTDFTGAWKLNPELTRRPEPSDRGFGGRRAPGSGGGRMPGGMGGIGGGGGTSGRGPGGMGGGYGGARSNPDEIARTREALRLAMLMPDRLTIVREAKVLLLTDGEGVTQKLSLDGKTVKSKAGALEVETKAKWDDGVLVVERKFEGDVKIVERYSIAPNPRQLVVAAKIESDQMSGDRARHITRVYDPLDAGS